MDLGCNCSRIGAKTIGMAFIAASINLKHQGVIAGKRRASLCNNVFYITLQFLKFSLQEKEFVKQFKNDMSMKNEIKVK